MTGGWGFRQRFVEGLKRRPGEWIEYPRATRLAWPTSRFQSDAPGTEWREVGRNPDGGVVMEARWVGAEPDVGVEPTTWSLRTKGRKT